MRRIILFAVISGVISIPGCSEEISPVSSIEGGGDMVVIRAYVYAGEPVSDIKITSVLPLGSEDQSAPPINDAQVTLIKSGVQHLLEPSEGDSGYYHYSGDNLIIETGDKLRIEVNYFDKIAFGETVVPEPPDSVSISNDKIIVPDLSGSGYYGSSMADTTNSTLSVSWANDDSLLYFITMENVDPNPQQIELELDMPFMQTRRFISQPTSRNSYVISFINVTHLGRHIVKVYRINQEYAELYGTKSQDSRDLNEPLTNIVNGLGVFSAFNSGSVYFDVVQDVPVQSLLDNGG